MRVVFDAGVVLAGAGWRHEAHHCLVLAAKRIALPYASNETLDELRRVAPRMEAEGWFKGRDPWPVLKWYLGFARRVEPVPLGKQRSRDLKDDPYLACALAARFPQPRRRPVLRGELTLRPHRLQRRADG